MGLTYKVQWL